MKLFPFFKKPAFFTDAEKHRIVEAIRHAEQQTSGEVRVYVESKTPYVETMDRAAEVFFDLKMDKTDHRNAVLLYIATTHKELALFGDEGIYNQTGELFWNNAVKKMMSDFNEDDICEGMVQCIKMIGETLKEKFPYNRSEDKNELPDEIVFGK